MLLNLFVKNFAIIDEINIQFKNGLNVLSGETGSGKSLLLKSLSILKGDRFSKEYIGIFSNQTIIEAVFNSNDKINSILQQYDIDIDENIILRRIFDKSSSITKINNRACSAKFMSQITEMLFDIHGQHSQLIVLDKSNYISIIDKFNPETIKLKETLSENIKLISSLNKQNEDLNISDDEIVREKDILKYQINEIETFNFDNYDEEKLNNEYKRLSNQADLISGTTSILETINTSNRDSSLKEMINGIYDKMLDLEKFDNDLKLTTSEVLNIRELIYDLSKNIESYSYGLEIDDERLQLIEDTFSAFHVLKMKYGKTPEEIQDFLKRIKKRYEDLSQIDKIRKNIENKINTIINENTQIANKLSYLRGEIIEKLEKRIVAELNEMNMQNILFKIKQDTNSKINKDGQDNIDFMISTNKGQELKSLSLVSSGGEISRFMLALKAVFIDYEEVNSIIFDEIDSGISGKTADIVGNKIKKISKKCQLIVISHLSQIASKADSHYLLFKETNEATTSTSIVELDYNGKINEIARLISGSDITENSLQTAKELIKENVND